MSSRLSSTAAACLMLACAVHVFLFLGSRPLWMPDEGRYAEIGREMLESGDWVTPRLDYVRYFEKPPLVYWLTAASLGVFGVGEWAARLPVAVLGLAGLWFTGLLGTAIGGRRTGLLAIVALITCPLYYGLSKFLVLDMALTTFITAGLCLFFRGLPPPGQEEASTPHQLGAAACLGLATLAKGPVGVILAAMAVAPTLAWLWLSGSRVRLPWVRMALVYLAVTAPWFVAVSVKHPEFPGFFFIHEHLDRFLKPDHQRPGPLWYFVPVLLIGALPWSGLLPAVVRHACRAPGPAATSVFLWSWIVLPFLFFSLSKSKLPAYILPVFPPLAVLIAAAFDRLLSAERSQDPGTGPLRRWMAAGFLLDALLMAAGAAVVKRSHPERILALASAGLDLEVILAGMSLLALGGAWTLARGRAATSFALLAAASAALTVLIAVGSRFYRGPADIRALATAVAAERRGGEPVVILGTLESASGLPFYLRGPVMLAGEHAGELSMARDAPKGDEALRFVDDSTAGAWMLPDRSRTLFVTHRRVYDSYFVRLPYTRLREFRREGDLVLFSNR